MHPTHWRLVCTYTITLTPLACGMGHIHSEREGLFCPLSLTRILEETRPCDNLDPWHFFFFFFCLLLPSLSPKDLCNRLTTAIWNRSVSQQQMLAHYLGLPRYQHRGCMSPHGHSAACLGQQPSSWAICAAVKLKGGDRGPFKMLSSRFLTTSTQMVFLPTCID